MAGYRLRVVENTLGGLADDLERVPGDADRELHLCVLRNAAEGTRLAKGFAKVSAGRHGKHYPDAIGYEETGRLTYEYGPDSAMPQGGMSFEYGSRNQTKPHLDLARSADIIAPKFADDAAQVLDSLFW